MKSHSPKRHGVAFWLLAATVLMASYLSPFKGARAASEVTSEVRKAAMSMLDDPLAAEAVFRRHNSFVAKAQLALLLGTELSSRPGIHDEIQSIFEELAGRVHEARKRLAIRLKESGRRRGAEIKPYKMVPYDGTQKSLVLWLKHLTWSAQHGIGIEAETVFVPCEMVRKYEALLRIEEPYDLGSGRKTPETNCKRWFQELPGSLHSYLDKLSKLLARIEGGYSGFYSSFTSRLKYADLRAKQDAAAVRPEVLLGSARGSKECSGVSKTPAAYTNCLENCRRPLEKWAYVGLWNWGKFQALQPDYEEAHADLKRHYIERFSFTPTDAAEAATKALRLFSVEVRWIGMGCPVGSLRHAILTDLPVEEIEQGLDSGRFSVDEWDGGQKFPGEDRNNIEYALGGSLAPEPLLHIAVLRADVLRLLLDRGLDVDQESEWLKKTPLMTAAQHDLEESIAVLLAAGADVNAQTTEHSLTFASRTPLMYAAANASLGVIKRLVAAGADITAKDSRGNQAVDYLDGMLAPPAKQKFFVPVNQREYETMNRVPANWRLSMEDRRIARDLLTP